MYFLVLLPVTLQPDLSSWVSLVKVCLFQEENLAVTAVHAVLLLIFMAFALPAELSIIPHQLCC